MLPPHLIQLPAIGNDSIGQLVVAEPPNLPFQVQRLYWTFGVPTTQTRGHHAHRLLQQLLVAAHGAIDVTIETRERRVYTFHLDYPDQALYVPHLCWREIKFDTDAVLLCMASMEYDEAEYIRDYQAFTQLVSTPA